jgi:subtilisin family serine protease
MKKIILSLGIFFTLSISAQNYAPNRLVVSLKTNRTAVTDLDVFQSLNTQYGCASMKQIGKGSRRITRSVDASTSDQGTIVLYFENNIDVKSAILDYKASGLFKYVEPDYKGQGESTIPNDPIFGTKQYYHVNSGNFTETPSHAPVVNADMDTDLAWDITTGSTSVVLGVFDSGLDFTNAEFTNRLWINAGEIPNNNIDDDNNGYIDDINGWDFVNNDNNATDDHSHGSNVTGIAAATGNNNYGMAGVDWNCKIMTLKVLASDNSGYYSDWSESLYYAADNGIHVGNLSLSGSSFSQSFQDAVDYAHNAGILVVVAMGNNDYGTVRYPAGFSNAMAIGATNPDDTRVNKVTNSSWGSNYGSHIDCVAGGQRVYSVRYNGSTSFTWWKGGTSMATPLVAGVACLVKSVDMNLTPDQIRNVINQTAEDQVGLSSEDVAGFDHYYGYGRVNAYQAVLAASTITTVNEVENSYSIYPNPMHEQFTIQTAQNGKVEVYGLAGQLVHQKEVQKGSTMIDVNGWSNGIYFVRFNQEITKIIKR